MVIETAQRNLLELLHQRNVIDDDPVGLMQRLFGLGTATFDAYPERTGDGAPPEIPESAQILGSLAGRPWLDLPRRGR
jgi:hypothetical protein